MQGSSGKRVVFYVLGGVALIAVFVAVGFLLFEPEKAPCASGEAAQNEFVNGAYVPRNETFDNVSDAEAFICHDVPELHADGWQRTIVRAERTVPLELIVEGEGYAAVTMQYENASLGRSLILDATPFFTQGGTPSPFTEEPVRVGSRDAKLIRGGINPNMATVIWVERGLQVRAVAQTDAAFTQDDLLDVLGTVR